MNVVLHMFRDNGHRRSFPLKRASIVIGRREDCDLRIPLGEVSRKHCRILVDGDDLRLEDLGSSNGTYHNGTRVQEAGLDAGDTVQIGPLAFVVQIDGAPSDQNLQPVLAEGSSAGAKSSPDPDGLNPTAQADAADGLDDDIFAQISDADGSSVMIADADDSGVMVASDSDASNREKPVDTIDDAEAFEMLNDDAEDSGVGMIDLDEDRA